MPKLRSPGNLWLLLNEWADRQRNRRHEETIVFILTLLIGAIVGLLVVAFIVVTENLGARMYPAGGAAWRRLTIPIVGALGTGFLLFRYFPNARGSGIPQTKTALFLRGGLIRFRTVVGKFTCSSVSLASGIALGREGPSVQVGAGIASALGQRLGLSPTRIKSLVPIGASAALAAAFNTPIAAVLFTLEEVMGDLHAPVLGAIVLSSATSWMVLHLLLGDEPLFHVPAYQLVHPIEFLFYAVLGIVGGFVSVWFVKTLLWMRKQFLQLPRWTQQFQPVIGGLVVGVLGWYVPEVLGVGYNHVSQALNGQLALTTMAMLVVLKLIATTTCYASGNAGGIFGPSLFVGAMMGGAVGGGAHFVLPDYTGSVGAYALVGMGAAFAGIIRVPLTSVIMIFEITRDYSIIVPLMIANLMSYFISSRLQEEPIYESLLHQDGIHLPPGPRTREEQIAVALGMHEPVETLSATESIEQALSQVSAGVTAWPVVKGAEFVGMATRVQLERGGPDRLVGETVPPIDSETPLTADVFPHVHSDHSLEVAIRRMAESGLDVIPVVSRDDVRKLIGVISLRDALAAYKDQNVEAAEPPYQESRTPIALLGGVLVVLVILVALAGFLSYFYREERGTRAAEHYRTGIELMKAERYQEATEQFRNALSTSHGARDRLALATALEKAGRNGEAAIYFRELLRDDPSSGIANLGLARIAALEHREDDSVVAYRRAISGSWKEDPAGNRVRAELELVDVLSKFNREKQVQVELLALASKRHLHVSEQKELGRLLLEHGLPKESADMFRQVVQKNDADASAWAWLGRAEYAQSRYRAANDAFANALRRNSSESLPTEEVRATEQILALNPEQPGLGTLERYRRSERLLEAVLGSLDQCAATAKGPQPAEEKETADEARKILLRHAGPRSYVKAAGRNLALGQQLWKLRIACGPPKHSEEPVARLMALVNSPASAK